LLNLKKKLRAHMLHNKWLKPFHRFHLAP
jgi:hypothetical protein